MKKITFLLTLFAALNFSAKAQIINTVAGNGNSGYSGDGTAANAAELDNPTRVALDAAGNVYIADYGNNRIRKISTSGIISTFAGNGTAGYSGDGGAANTAKLYDPTGVAVDAAGNVYIADNHNNVIRKVNTSGIISTIAGNGFAGYSGDGAAATAAEFDAPAEVTLDAVGNLYIVDELNNCIREVNTSGIVNTIAGNGNYGFSGDGGAATAAELALPTGVAVDASGNVYIADHYNNRIRKINTSGIISTIAGIGTGVFNGDGEAATAAELSLPEGLTVDAAGNIFIADYGNNRIRKINTSGIISTIAGNGTEGFSGDGGTAISAELDSPTGVTLDAAGNLYIADYFNDRIREVTGLTGVTENKFSNTTINVFPNPSNGIFNIVEKNNFQQSSLEIYNVLGEKIISTTLTASQTQIDLSDKAKGIYFYKVVSADGKYTSVGKFILE